MRISVYEFANAIKVPRSRTDDIVLRRRGITADTAMRLGRYFGTSPEFWINLQARYDLDVTNRTLWRKIKWEVAPRSAAHGDLRRFNPLNSCGSILPLQALSEFSKELSPPPRTSTALSPKSDSGCTILSASSEDFLLSTPCNVHSILRLRERASKRTKTQLGYM
jgi:addiction module HigA family antidote